ncbi:exoglucanase B-like [Anthonomus grandis grandis]|uniref:exoglucanase B-like n=1 Tax=Anthonomus grandis grandis TaxID=2921223 RepID=UPI0021669090|nr:exoglucanase B-like [Anthonomus grandis grandis]
MQKATILLLALVAGIQAGTYIDRFKEQYEKIHNSANGYFSSEGIPFHAVETLVVEAPDYGHETTSEAYSYYLWLEAVNGYVTGDFSSFNAAFNNLETYIIPTFQPTLSGYNTWKPATYADEKDLPSEYPSWMQTGVPVGQDPIYQELKAAYNQDFMYSMHWLLDVENKYGFGDAQGQCEAGPTEAGPSLINTFQRGPQESVWRTIPQPTCDVFKYGGKNGFLDLFVGDNSYTQQWKYTAAPDADARVVQATYWAIQWAKEKNVYDSISSTVAKVSKMGDYLRYTMYDKYFKKVGNCVGPYVCPGGSGKESAHYLINWYFAWGGAMPNAGNWAWIIGDGAAHFGYQNPMTAYALSQVDELKPKGATSVEDWATSLERQLELYEFLQTSEGAFAGGVTNSWNGRYDTPTSNLTSDTFHGMFYDWEPVYHDPPSNRWYGMQAWSVDRLAQYYYITKDSKAESILKKWVAWVLTVVKVENGDFQMPDHLTWQGVPPEIHVNVGVYTHEIGTASATARALSYWAAASGDSEAKALAKGLLDALYNYASDKGITIPETPDQYGRFEEPVYVPAGWTGTYPYGDIINSSATFVGIRSWFKQDSQWSKIQTILDGGDIPEFEFHRFWAQTDVAIAFGVYGILFDE